MKLVKVADLEALLGSEAAQRVVAAITAKKAKPKKPLPEYTLLVSETIQAVVRVSAVSEREARRLVLKEGAGEVDTDEALPTLVRAKILKPAAKVAPAPVIEAKTKAVEKSPRPRSDNKPR